MLFTPGFRCPLFSKRAWFWEIASPKDRILLHLWSVLVHPGFVKNHALFGKEGNVQNFVQCLEMSSVKRGSTQATIESRKCLVADRTRLHTDENHSLTFFVIIFNKRTLSFLFLLSFLVSSIKLLRFQNFKLCSVISLWKTETDTLWICKPTSMVSRFSFHFPLTVSGFFVSFLSNFFLDLPVSLVKSPRRRAADQEKQKPK